MTQPSPCSGTGQLALDTEPLGIVATCAWCGAHTAPIPVDGGAGASWGQATSWAWLALKRHEEDDGCSRQLPGGLASRCGLA